MIIANLKFDIWPPLVKGLRKHNASCFLPSAACLRREAPKFQHFVSLHPLKFSGVLFLQLLHHKSCKNYGGNAAVFWIFTVRGCHNFFHIYRGNLNHISSVDLIFSCKNHFLDSTPDLSQCRLLAKSQNFGCYRALFLIKITFQISKTHRESFNIAFRNVDFYYKIEAISETYILRTAKAPPFDLPVRIPAGHGWSPKSEFKSAPRIFWNHQKSSKILVLCRQSSIFMDIRR